MRINILLITILLIQFFSCTTNEQETKKQVINNIELHEEEAITEEDSGNDEIKGKIDKDWDDTNYYKLYQLLNEGDFDEAEVLFNSISGDINAYERNSFCNLTLLYQFTSGNENAAAVSFLLKNSVDPNTPSAFCEEGETIVYTSSCNESIAKLLIDAGSKYALDALMECAVRDKNMDKILKLLNRKANPSIALSVACKNHDLELFNKLLDLGADINQALYWATESEDMEMISLMLDRGAVITRYSSVAYSKNEEIKEALVNAIDGLVYSELTGGEGFCDGSHLINAAGVGDFEAVKFMLNAGADPNQFCWQNPDSNVLKCSDACALGAAESNGHSEIVDLLSKLKSGDWEYQ